MRVSIDAGVIKATVAKAGVGIRKANEKFRRATILALGKFSEDTLAQVIERAPIRSGDLRGSGFTDGPTFDGNVATARIGLNKPYARIQDIGGVVKPKKARMLAIPLAPVLTASGVAKFSSPRQDAGLELAKLGRGLFLIKRAPSGRKGLRAVLHWMLVPSVTIKGTRYFSQTVEERTTIAAASIAGLVKEIVDGGSENKP